jgi:2-methylcitrate dehydratase PrpD
MNVQKSLDEILCRFLSDLKFEDLSKSTLEYTKLLIVDYFASSVAGFKVNRRFNDAVFNVINGMGGTHDSTVMCYGNKLPAANAAFINAAFSHGADMDDGHRRAGAHPGGPVISSVLAVSETLPVTGKDVLLAIVCGYEAMIRIAAAVQPEHVSKGFHSTGTVGVAGAAVACAKLMGMGYEGILYALSLSLVQSAGLMLVTQSGQSSKPINPARAAYTGVLSAQLVSAGAVGPSDPLESKKGFFHAFGENIKPDEITQDLGRVFQIEGCYIKPYPCCRATHAGADAMLFLRKEIKCSGDVKKIELYIYPKAIFIAGDKCNHVPYSVESSKFSLAFAIASILHNGNISVDDIINFDSTDPEIFETCKKVVLISDPSTEDVDAGRRGCRLKVILKDQTVLSKEIIIPKGDPEFPMTMQDIRNKLAACGNDILSKKKQKTLYQNICNLETVVSLDGFMNDTVADNLVLADFSDGSNNMGSKRRL